MIYDSRIEGRRLHAEHPKDFTKTGWLTAHALDKGTVENIKTELLNMYLFKRPGLYHVEIWFNPVPYTKTKRTFFRLTAARAWLKSHIPAPRRAREAQ